MHAVIAPKRNSVSSRKAKKENEATIFLHVGHAAVVNKHEVLMTSETSNLALPPFYV